MIRIRIQGLKGDAVARIIQRVIEAAESDLVAGVAITVTDRRLALRRLPLIASDDHAEPDDETNGS